MIKKIIKRFPKLYKFLLQQKLKFDERVNRYVNRLKRPEDSHILYLIGTRNSKTIRKMKNIHVGERCFIIGNGPSLTIDDLEKLKDEYTFATNRIYGLYDKTDWRPTYYCIQDRRLINLLEKDFEKILECSRFNFFIYQCHNHSVRRLIKEHKKSAMFYLAIENYTEESGPGFAKNAAVKMYEGYTITYTAIQLAVYMGFKEIYLLGVDHSYSVNLDRDGKKHGTEVCGEDYAQGLAPADYKQMNLPQLGKSTAAYMAARRYAEAHGIKIYNATRGGKLEVFERADFDLVLRDKTREEKKS